MATTKAHPVRKIVLDSIYHESHGRITRRTWTATLQLADGTEQGCGHDAQGHKTHAAAAACGQRVAAKIWHEAQANTTRKD